eukprot:m.204452 g.204452  ORF g.204452 m.204452 type:complete len:219 (+) comp39644_c0_seq52:2393-3049(+)
MPPALYLTLARHSTLSPTTSQMANCQNTQLKRTNQQKVQLRRCWTVISIQALNISPSCSYFRVTAPKVRLTKKRLIACFRGVSAPHVSIVTLNLHSIAFYPTQIDIPLSERQYTDCLSSQECSFQVSNVLSLTLSDYVFVNAFGALQAYSMVSGNLVLCNREVTGEELWVRGCVLNHRQSSLQKASLLSLAYHNGGIIVVSCAKLCGEGLAAGGYQQG